MNGFAPFDKWPFEVGGEGEEERALYPLPVAIAVGDPNTPGSLTTSRNCSSRSLRAAYRSTGGVELMDELDELKGVEPLELSEPLVELSDMGRPIRNIFSILITEQV